MPSKIKIAHIINFLSPGGKEMGIVKLLNHMDGSRFQGYLIVLNQVINNMILDESKTKIISLNKGKGNDWKLPLRLASILKQEQIDIVHTHAWGTLVEGVAGARMARVPLVVHGEHGTFHTDFKRKWVQKFFFGRCDALLTVSGTLGKRLEHDLQLKAGSFKTIFNGVDSDYYRQNPDKRTAARQTFAVDDETVVIGTVGRTVTVKNQVLLVQAAKLLAEQNLEFKMMIVGDAHEYSLLDDLKQRSRELDVTDFMIFPGSRDDVPDLLNAFDVFVLPSLSEGCSNVIQEAMATALPVVASDVGGNPELVEPGVNGFLFESNNAPELANYLEQLILDASKRTAFGAAGLKKMQASFSLQQMVSRYESFYSTSLDRKRNGRVV